MGGHGGAYMNTKWKYSGRNGGQVKGKPAAYLH